MYHHSEGYKKPGSFFPVVIFRLILSVLVLLIFIIGIYQAFKYFSGVDPVKLDPKEAVLPLLTSNQSADLVSTLFGIQLPKNIIQDNSLNKVLGSNNSQPSQAPENNSPLSFKFALVADSHNDNQDLAAALSQAKADGAEFVIGLGDYTDVGTADELTQAKAVFDASGLSYYLVPGDHDLWNGRDKGVAPIAYFSQVFGPDYQSFASHNVRFILLDNGDNYLGVDSLQMDWLENELSRVKTEKPIDLFIMLHEPIYHPSSDHFMGDVTPKLVDQANQMGNLFQKAGVTEVFAGDIHFFSRYQDPRTGLKMTTAGAVTDQRNAQAPRFSIVDVYKNGSYNVEDLEIKH